MEEPDDDIRQEYSSRLSEVKAEFKWADDDVIIFPDDVTGARIVVLQCPEHLFVSVGCRQDERWVYLITDLKKMEIVSNVRLGDIPWPSEVGDL